jgi:ribosomal protein S1
MIEVKPNPELDYLFEEESTKLKTKEYLELSKLYEESIIKSFKKIPEVGEILSGKYKGVSSGYYVFSINGLKDDIRVDKKASESKYLEDIKIGDVVDILITEVNNDLNFIIMGSISTLHETRAHDDLMSFDRNQPVLANISELTPAGYVVNFKYGGVKLKGFMPNTLAGVNKLSDPDSLVGKDIYVVVESFSNKEGTYIISRRSYLESLIPEEIERLENGKIYSGFVTGTTPFGVFVEFNDCLTGMIHKANLYEEYRERIDEIKPGMVVEFYIKEVINERNKSKIILTQVLRETIWDTIKNGQIIEAKVKDVKAFGTLVILDEETMGLIHSSEMAKLNRTFKKGEDLKVKVLSTDRTSRKIFLTMP